MLKIFDSLVHPTLSGDINKHGTSTSFSDIALALASTSIKKILAVGMPSKSYEHEKFYKACQQHPQFIPVAALTLNTAPVKELRYIKEVGYKAIKIHPRSLVGRLDEEILETILNEAAELDLRVLLCTYCYFDLRNQNNIFLTDLLKVVSKSPKNLKLVLVHGGVFVLF